MIYVYWIVTALCLVFAACMPQHGSNRKWYIILMAVIHGFVSAFRYRFLTGDLLKYNTEFQDVHYFAYFSERLVREGKNTAFYWLMKFLCDTTNGYFPSLLIVTSIVIEITLAILIYRYSPRPWLSYLIWNCFGFYIFGFSAVKQAFAMAFIVLAGIEVLEDRPIRFLFFTILAGLLHFPAFAFLPAYWIAKMRINKNVILFYILVAGLIYIFRNPIVNFMTTLYYEDDEMDLTASLTVGGRFLMMILILVVAIFMKGFSDRRFEKLFNLMIIAAIFQMFSSYNNVFTRFADYYFQFSVIFIPMMFSSRETDPQIGSTNAHALLPFNEKSLFFLVFVLSVMLTWYYQTTTLGRTSRVEHDYLDYHFDWDPEADAWRQ